MSENVFAAHTSDGGVGHSARYLQLSGAVSIVLPAKPSCEAVLFLVGLPFDRCESVQAQFKIFPIGNHMLLRMDIPMEVPVRDISLRDH